MMSSPLNGSTSEPPVPDSFRWSFTDLIVFGLGFALTVFLLPAAAVIAKRALQPESGAIEFTGVELVLMQGLMDLILVGLIFLLVRLYRRSFLRTIHWQKAVPHFPPRSLLICGGLLAVAVMIVSSFFKEAAPTPIEKLLTSSESMLVFAIFGIGVAPLAEEIIFRGFVFEILQDLGGANAAVLVTTVLFASLHVLQLWGNWPAVALIFCVGFVLGFIRKRTSSLIPSVLIHIGYNAMLFVAFAIGTLLGAQPR